MSALFPFPIKRLVALSLCLSTGIVASSAPSMAQFWVKKKKPEPVVEQPLDSPVEAEVVVEKPVVVEHPLVSVLHNARGLKHKKALKAFYEARGYETYWTRGESYKLRSHSDDFIERLEESWTHGLNPFSYHLEAIRDIEGGESGEDRALLEFLLSDAYVRYGQDLSGIRVDPRPLKSHKRFWQQPIVAKELLSYLQERDVKKITRPFTPRGETYNRMRDELVALTKQKPATYEAILPIRMKGLLKPYNEHRAVRDLRVRFGLADDGNQSYVYDDALAAAVIKFQRANGLKADAVIGPSTLRAINRTRKDKMHQIIANLERLRWIAEEKPEKFVIVNIPSATLWAVDDGRVEFEMPVIVGRKKRPTNMFVTEITGVRLNPTWTVPPTIKKEDIAPKLVNDPLYLANKGIELSASVEGGGRQSLDPASIDWANVTEGELRGLRMVQTSGAHNPLGSVRVLMPNGYNIYLHDTNEKYLFSRAARAASSGCVRMKDPRRMANFILEEKKGWSDERMNEILGTRKMKDLFIQNLIPVYLVYYTAWIDGAGTLVYGNDLYDYDSEIIKMLSNIDGFFIPVDNTSNKAGVVVHNTHSSAP